MGYYVDGTDYKPLALRSDGGAWERVPSPDQDDGDAIFRDIDASSATDAWAVGFEYRAEPGDYVATTQHWDGSAVDRRTELDRPARREERDARRRRPPNELPGVGGRTDPRDDRSSTANVETICPSGNPAGDAVLPGPRRLARRHRRPSGRSAGTDGIGPAPARPSASDASATPVAGPTPVRAVDKAAEAGIQETTRDLRGRRRRLRRRPVTGHLSWPSRKPATSLPQRRRRDASQRPTTARQSFGRGRIDRHGCDAADVNQDGLEDIFCAVGALHGVGTKQNGLFIQRPDNTFVDRAPQVRRARAVLPGTIEHLLRRQRRCLPRPVDGERVGPARRHALPHPAVRQPRRARVPSRAGARARGRVRGRSSHPGRLRRGRLAGSARRHEQQQRACLRPARLPQRAGATASPRWPRRWASGTASSTRLWQTSTATGGPM